MEDTLGVTIQLFRILSSSAIFFIEHLDLHGNVLCWIIVIGQGLKGTCSPGCPGSVMLCPVNRIVNRMLTVHRIVSGERSLYHGRCPAKEQWAVACHVMRDILLPCCVYYTPGKVYFLLSVVRSVPLVAFSQHLF